MKHLLRLYPRAWRERYGDELLALMEETDGGTLDIVRAGLAERLRSAGAAGPHLVVLMAWGLFTLAGGAYAKWVEHWDAATPPSARHVPQLGYDVVLVGAIVGSVVVVLGALITAPRILELLREGGWAQIRRPVLRATAITLVTGAALVALAAGARNVGVASVFAIGVAGSVASWTAAAVSIARRLEFGSTLLRVETLLAACATLAMGAMTGGATVWWVAVAHNAPRFMGAAPPQMIVIGLAMVAATGLAAAATTRAAALSR